MNEGFFGTLAPRYAGLMLLFEIGMGLGLLGGGVLARRKRFRLHACCQSVVVLINFATILLVMVPVVSGSRQPKDTGQAWQGLLFSGDGARGYRRGYRNRSVVHSTVGRHEYFAAAIPPDQLQDMDAKCPRSLVAGALIRRSNLHPLVCPGSTSEMNR